MLTEARRSYALYRSSHGGDTLCRLKLTDGSGRIFGVVEQRLRVRDGQLPWLKLLPSLALIATGLALRSFD